MTYTYQPELRSISTEDAGRALQSTYPGRVHAGPVNADDGIDSVETSLRALGTDVQRLRVDPARYRSWLARAEYSVRYPDYYRGNFPEKSFEHFVVDELGALSPGRVLVDIASEHSPLGEIASRLHSCVAYSQDIMYPAGIHANRIGSDASNLPVEAGSFDLAAVTCSIEHFEGDADVRFMNEMQRTLRPGGKVVIVPLYLYQRASVQTDPVYAVAEQVRFDEGAEIYATPGWGNRHGRFYSPQTLVDRLIKPNPRMKFRVLRIENPADVDPSIYCRFALEGTRLPDGPEDALGKLRRERDAALAALAIEREKSNAILLAQKPPPIPPPKPIRYWMVDAINDGLKKAFPPLQKGVRALVNALRK